MDEKLLGIVSFGKARCEDAVNMELLYEHTTWCSLLDAASIDWKCVAHLHIITSSEISIKHTERMIKRAAGIPENAANVEQARLQLNMGLLFASAFSSDNRFDRWHTIGLFGDRGLYVSRDLTWVLIIAPPIELIRTVVSQLGERLELLDIRFTALSVLELPSLVGLKTLDLSCNDRLEKLDGIRQGNLETLNLSQTLVGPTIDVSGCTKLKTLDLSGNVQLQLVRGIRQCADLDTLNLSRTSVGPTIDVSGCTKLQTLDLSGNVRLQQGSGIQQCADLDTLNLSRTSVGPTIDVSGCTKLKTLNLSRTSVGPAIDVSGCTKLQTLDLSGNRNLQLVRGIRRCCELETVDLSGTSVGPVLDVSNWEHLKALRVPYGQGLNRLKGLNYLQQLQKLDLSFDEKKDSLYSAFRAFFENPMPARGNHEKKEKDEEDDLAIFNKIRGGLRYEVHSGETLTESKQHLLPRHFLGDHDEDQVPCLRLPEEIRYLKSLKLLNLSGLTLEALPDWLPELELDFHLKGNTGILLGGTKVPGLDMSIFSQSQELILQWFKERKLGKGADLNEVKVVFLGNGDVGKTHTIARLLNDGGEPENFDGNSTPGIVITNKTYRIGDRDVKVHFWDFGGQEILHSMHRMFLTERTLYVVLINARDDTQDDRSWHWLHTVKSFANDAPVLLVLNKMDQNPNASVNETGLRENYPNLTEVVKLSAMFDDREKFNANFTDAMKRQIGKMENLGSFFPDTWTKAKQKLLTMTDNYIRGSEYTAICDECGVSDERDLRKDLLKWFNDLGVSICYSKNIRLQDYVILRPNWIVNAVYAVLFNKHPKNQNGIISHTAILEMIQPPDTGVDPYRRTNSEELYTLQEIDYILGVTRQFRLSFRVDDGSGEEREFIPMLCGRDALEISGEYTNDPSALEFHMTFDYLPENVLHRLMVELRQDLNTAQVWHTGALFEQKGCGLSALVTSDGQKRNVLKIYVRSKKREHKPNTYLCILKDAIDRIAKEMNLTVSANAVLYKLEGKVQAFDYDELVESLEYGETTRYSRAHKRRLKIEDILNQTGHHPSEAREKLVEDMLTVCAQMQANRNNRDAYEDDRNTYIRDLLRAKGYLVADQSFSGTSAGGRRAGELDLLILDAPDHLWTLCEAMNLSGRGESQIKYWNDHLQKLLGCYDANGMPFLFLISYVDCGAEKFGQIAAAYYEHLRFYSPGRYGLQSVEAPSVSSPRREQNQYIQTAKCVYDREGFPTEVYHIFVRMGG